MKRMLMMKRKVVVFLLVGLLTVTGLIGSENLEQSDLYVQAASKLKVNMINNQEMWVMDEVSESWPVRVLAGAAGPLKCTSSNSSVVSVSGNMLTAEKAGKAKVTVKSGKRKVSYTIVVKKIKSEKSIFGLKGFRNEGNGYGSVVVQNKTNRPLVAILNFTCYGKNWENVLDGAEECAVSLNANGKQRVYFKISDEVEHVKLAKIGETRIRQVGHKSMKADVDLTVEQREDSKYYAVDNKKERIVYWAYTKLQYYPNGKLYQLKNAIFNQGEGLGKEKIEWDIYDGEQLIMYDLVVADGIMWLY